MRNFTGMMPAVMLTAAMMCAAFSSAEETCEDCVPALQIGEWITGGPHTLGDGTLYLVEFWSTTCPHCAAAIPHLSALQDAFGPCGVQVVALSMEAASTVRSFVEAQGDAIRYDVAVDNNWATFRAYDGLYDIPGVPHAFLVDGTGKLLWQGHPENESLTEQLESITACEIGEEEQPVTEFCGCYITSAKDEGAKAHLQRMLADWLLVGLSFMALAALTVHGRN